MLPLGGVVNRARGERHETYRMFFAADDSKCRRLPSRCPSAAESRVRSIRQRLSTPECNLAVRPLPYASTWSRRGVRGPGGAAAPSPSDPGDSARSAGCSRCHTDLVSLQSMARRVCRPVRNSAARRDDHVAVVLRRDLFRLLLLSYTAGISGALTLLALQVSIGYDFFASYNSVSAPPAVRETVLWVARCRSTWVGNRRGELRLGPSPSRRQARGMAIIALRPTGGIRGAPVIGHQARTRVSWSALAVHLPALSDYGRCHAHRVCLALDASAQYRARLSGRAGQRPSRVARGIDLQLVVTVDAHTDTRRAGLANAPRAGRAGHRAGSCTGSCPRVRRRDGWRSSW